jgi:hypothetical protein
MIPCTYPGCYANGTVLCWTGDHPPDDEDTDRLVPLCPNHATEKGFCVFCGGEASRLTPDGMHYECKDEMIALESLGEEPVESGSPDQEWDAP